MHAAAGDDPGEDRMNARITEDEEIQAKAG